jgi:hypothetical protein
LKKLNGAFSRKILNSNQFVLPQPVLSFFLTVTILIFCQSHLNGYEPQDILRVHFVDVGYGDAIFIEFTDSSNMLIEKNCPRHSLRAIYPFGMFPPLTRL